MKKTVLFLFLLIATRGFSQTPDQITIYPTSWWVGMKNPHLQVMLHGISLKGKKVSIQYPGIHLDKIDTVKNSNFLFLNLTIGPNAKPGNIRIKLDHDHSPLFVMLELKTISPGKGISYARGVNSTDFIYLLMPDRFSNGDPSNDHFSDMRDTTVDRKNPLSRHGGDIQGVINHLDYIRQLGATTIWLTPVIENDMPLEEESAGWVSGYHGYWFTDHYQIDKRLGGSEAYRQLIKSAHDKGLKIIQDAVYNHIGSRHWLMNDLPDSTWINFWPSYQNTSHREQALFDIHAAGTDREVMTGGWFVPHLPDLNLKNSLLATYLIQQAIWMTETYQLDGWRVDTYKYCDEEFLNKLNAALYAEFPAITSLAESTVSSVAAGAYFCRNNLDIPFKSNGTGILDFPVCNGLLKALKPTTGWSSGVMNLYTTLAEDMLYKDPMNNCIFLDNHDRDRFYSLANEDWNNFKIGLGLLLTERGIPQLYYGTEILMKNFKNPSDAMVREDFPGGFPGDTKNKFTTEGRNKQENEAFHYISKLANFRKNSPALTKGKLMHYIPVNGLYAYARYTASQTIFCMLNTDTLDRSFHFEDYKERTKGFDMATDILTGNTYQLTSPMQVAARSIRILELKKRATDNKVVH